ncbi:uncharacterized protein TNCT_216741 [Trichonephila clavata]|uniref:C2H2-type domain-containing protein n=1 Tax=Trichonephila clavata TaxID=2740835 RepID=A0A8X6M3W1_TRICU|nr:uncharacterized protein TNCT_216741 [Trichonephila clavata]
MEPWCAHCSTRLRTAPAAHPCFKNMSLMQGGTLEGKWSCADCNFVATTRNGLLNHEKVHKRERLRQDIPPLQIPLDPKTRRRNKNKKLASLTTGQPGDTPLAARAIDLPTSEEQSREEVNATRQRERIDVQEPAALLSFQEPLDMLLGTEDLQNRKDHFEVIVQGLTTAVLGHFNLSKPPVIGTGSTRKGLDLLNPQLVQKAYRWNRRKCIRAITSPSGARCLAPKEEVYGFYKNMWESGSSPVERPMPEPPTRPAIVESLSQAFVLSCL